MKNHKMSPPIWNPDGLLLCIFFLNMRYANGQKNVPTIRFFLLQIPITSDDIAFPQVMLMNQYIIQEDNVVPALVRYDNPSIFLVWIGEATS